MTWYNNSHGHWLARYGVSSSPPQQKSVTNIANKKDVEINNMLQKKMHELDKSVRHLAKLNKIDLSFVNEIENVRAKYDKTGAMITDFLRTRGSPSWLVKTWFGNESFNQYGKVSTLLRKLEITSKNYLTDSSNAKLIQIKDVQRQILSVTQPKEIT